MASLEFDDTVQLSESVKEITDKNISNSEYIRDLDQNFITKIMNVKQIIDKNDTLSSKIYDIIQSINPELKAIDNLLSKQYCEVSILLSNEKNPYDFLEKLPAKDIQASLSHASILINSVDEFQIKIKNILLDYLKSLEKETKVVDGIASSNLNYSEISQ